MKHKITFLLFIVFMVSCSKEQVPVISNDEGLTKWETKSSSSPSLFDCRSESDVTKMVLEMSGKDTEITKVEMVGNEMAPTSYYIITFVSSGDDGFSVIPADNRIKEPLCFVPHGKPSDSSMIQPLAVFFDNIPSYLESVEKELNSGNIDEQTKSMPVIRPGDGILVDQYTEIVQDTVLCATPTNWGQCPPLGTLIFDDNGYCSVVAVAQTLAYHQKPYSDFITTNDWPNMINGLDNVSVAYLGYDLHCSLYFPGDLIPPTAVRVRNFFNDNGFTATNHSSFTSSNVMTYLEDGPAVVLGFYDSGVFNLDTGHYWVVDGGMSTSYTHVDVYEYEVRGQIITYEVRETPITYYQFHYNWGWADESNGWYNGGVFQSTSSNHNFRYNMFTIHIVG